MVCPFCKEDIKDGAIKCRYCGSILNGSSHEISSLNQQNLNQSTNIKIRSANAEATIICPYCLQKVSEVAVRCTNCGRNLKSSMNSFASFWKILEPILLIAIFVSYFLDWLTTRWSSFLGVGPGHGDTAADILGGSWIPIVALLLILMNFYWYLYSLRNFSRALHITKRITSILLGIFVIVISFVIFNKISSYRGDSNSQHSIGIGLFLAISCGFALTVFSILSFKNLPKSDEL